MPQPSSSKNRHITKDLPTRLILVAREAQIPHSVEAPKYDRSQIIDKDLRSLQSHRGLRLSKSRNKKH
ncbi:hypothetical protein GBA52_012445 [Prunus armeniaca]|nr:hypothetical protein GBA52_012445 [Prunus armeniaca]